MIKSIKFNQGDSEHKNFTCNLPSIIKRDGLIEFKEGLNIIVGPTGSGKTSILKSIASYLAADQSGVSQVTSGWIKSLEWSRNTLFDSESEKHAELVDYFKVEHDGQPLIFGDPKRQLGIDNGQIDEDFYTQGIFEHLEMSSESTGEQCNRRLVPFIEHLLTDRAVPENICIPEEFNNVNDIWKGRFAAAKKNRLTPTIEKGQPTMLLDEPESGLGLLNGILLWKTVLKNPDVISRNQIIIVSHNPNAINIEGANYIELKEGYLDTCRKALAGEIGIKGMREQAANLQDPLTSTQIKMLKRAAKGNLDYDSRRTPTSVKHLLSVDYLREYCLKNFLYREQTDETMSRQERTLVRNKVKHMARYKITEKGRQYLNFSGTGVN